MTIEGIIESKLGKILEDLDENPENEISSQVVITLLNTVKSPHSVTSMGGGEPDENSKKLPVFTLYVSNKYAQFHNEFTQIAYNAESLKPLIKYLENNGWKTNLD